MTMSLQMQIWDLNRKNLKCPYLQKTEEGAFLVPEAPLSCTKSRENMFPLPDPLTSRDGTATCSKSAMHDSLTLETVKNDLAAYMNS